MSENTIEIRQTKSKEAIIEQVKKTPIIQIACEKCGVSRATYYRWKKDDKEFATTVEQALNDGAELVSDMAESKLVSSIKDGNLTAIMFWLKNRHKNYATKLEMINQGRSIIEKLSPEQEAIVQKALEFATFTLPEETKLNEPHEETETHEQSTASNTNK